VVYSYHIKERRGNGYLGEFIRELRLKAGLTLRHFCQLTGFDPSNWSKIERGLLSPPKSKAVLIEIARVLNLTEESEDYKTLFDLAAIGQIPVDFGFHPPGDGKAASFL